MKAAGVVLLAIVSSAVTAMLIAQDPPAPRQPRIHAGGDLSDELDTMRREQAALRAQLRELQARLTAGDEFTKSIEAVVARILKERETRTSKPVRAADIREAIAVLLDPARGAADKRKIWDALIEKGHIDAAVAEFERRARASPRDAVAQFQLGAAYHQKMRTVGGGAAAGRWGQKGSDAYTKALTLDPTNWEARFAQAQHFYWAEMKGDSLRHLDVLRKQQPGRAAEDRDAGMFVFLGNLYLEMRNREEAKSVWAEGVRFFPSNNRLRALLEALEEGDRKVG